MLEHIYSVDGLPGPFLVVVPLSTIEHWRREFEAWTDMRFCMYYDVVGRSTHPPSSPSSSLISPPTHRPKPHSTSFELPLFLYLAVYNKPPTHPPIHTGGSPRHARRDA